VESIFTLLALRDGIIPPTMNLVNPGEGCNLDYCAGTARRDNQIRVAMKNSFGFGGTNATVIFRTI
jgi:3-oxoacyl-[acyl-carrier-protein] synthase II